jgi:hypothetical protein
MLASKWPSTTVLLTSRPVQALSAAHEHRRVPALTEVEQLECVSISAGEAICQGSLYSIPEPVRVTLAQPLFRAADRHLDPGTRRPSERAD